MTFLYLLCFVLLVTGTVFLLELTPEGITAGFHTTPQQHPIPGAMVPGRPFLLPSTAVPNPVYAADRLPKPHPIPLVGAFAPAVDTVRKNSLL